MTVISVVIVLVKSPVIIQLTVALYCCSSVPRYSGQVKGCHETRTRRKPDPGTMTVPVRAYTKTQSAALANICFTHESAETEIQHLILQRFRILVWTR